MAKHALVEKLDEPETCIANSKWVQRGWTYRELLLSQRRLFSRQSGVYFECNEHCQIEGRQDPVFHNDELGTQLASRDLYDNSMAPIWRHIQAYTRRHLTYRSDFLKGILGIFHHLQRSSQGPVICYWGIPILLSKPSSSAITGFVRGLCWKTQGKKGVRRPAFPSWSWCGWDHAPKGVNITIAIIYLLPITSYEI